MSHIMRGLAAVRRTVSRQRGLRPNGLRGAIFDIWLYGILPAFLCYLLVLRPAAGSIVLRARVRCMILSETALGLYLRIVRTVRRRKPMSLDDRRLIRAIVRSDERDVRARLSQGADANVSSKDGVPLILIAVRKGNHKIVAALLERGADANAQIPIVHESAVMIAVSQRSHSIAELLLASGANPNIGNFAGIRPIMRAAAEGDAPAVRLLLDHGADYRISAWCGLSALDFAARLRHRDIATLFRDHAAN